MVRRAINEFVRGTNATPDQLKFIDIIVSERTVNGVVEAKRQCESLDLDFSLKEAEALFRGA